MSNNNRFNEVRSQCSMGTSWLWFYTRVLLILHMIFTAISLFLAFSRVLAYTFTPYAIIPLVSGALSFWLCINSYIGILNFTEKGYKYNRAYLWFMVSVNTLSILVTPDVSTPTLLGSFIGSAIWLIPNLVYFKKRRYLFSDAQTSDQSTVM